MPAVIDPPISKSHVSAALLKQASPVLQSLGPMPRLFSVKEYDLMLASGVLREGEKSELLNGVINQLMTKGPKHCALTNRAARIFDRAYGDRVMIRKEDPIILDDHSEPEPDLVIARPDKTEYADRHPGPSDILLILEVADSSLAYDRDEKGLAYARAGLPQFLLINVNNHTIVDYREPSAEGYRSQVTYVAGQSFTLVAFPDKRFVVNEFLPE